MADFVQSKWQDLTPIPQYEGEDPVAQIAYPREFVEQMDIFRALIAKGEYSERAFNLTTSLLSLNPASYTVWQYRRECLRKLNSNLVEELDFMDGFASENPKNYQIWYHRRVIVEILNKSDRELDFTAAVFEVDGKNYHAWAHRQWAIQKFNLWDDELTFVEECISDDIRNNSAWNQRWFVVHKGPVPITHDILQREVDYVWNSINQVKKNESSWNYLRGLVRFHPELKQTVIKRCEEFLSNDENQNYLSVGFLADLYEMEGDKVSLLRAKDLMIVLLDIDIIRIKSWARRIDSLNQVLATS